MRSLLTLTVNTLILYCCTIQNDEDGDDSDDDDGDNDDVVDDDSDDDDVDEYDDDGDDSGDDDVDVHAMLCNGFVVAATTAMPPSRQR